MENERTNQQETHDNQLVSFIWNIANKLRGPYRPPQYRRVMLPLIVLRRFDTISQIIAAAVEQGLIKNDFSAPDSKRYARYIPAWA